MQIELLAFLLTILAGGCTGIGAAVVFSPKLIKLASKKVLAASLGLSSGVMLYVSFVEIFQKSVMAFSESYGERKGYLYATITFFAGVLIMKLIDRLVDKLNGGEEDGENLSKNSSSSVKKSTINKSSNNNSSSSSSNNKDCTDPDCTYEHDLHLGCVCHTTPDEIDSWQARASKEVELMEQQIDSPSHSHAHIRSNSFSESPEEEKIIDPNNLDISIHEQTRTKELKLTPGLNKSGEEATSTHDKKLSQMGLTTALAIAIHNFPEGLATFVATIADPTVGLSLAVAIAIHNVPEGLCVSVPIFYATGDRKKAFLWGCLSGVSEPVGALLGWVILKNFFNNTIYGIMFGSVSGMMTMIVLHELLPTAHRYDPKDKIVTNSVVLGMIIMSLSLVLFVVI